MQKWRKKPDSKCTRQPKCRIFGSNLFAWTPSTLGDDNEKQKKMEYSGEIGIARNAMVTIFAFLNSFYFLCTTKIHIAQLLCCQPCEHLKFCSKCNGKIQTIAIDKRGKKAKDSKNFRFRQNILLARIHREVFAPEFVSNNKCFDVWASIFHLHVCALCVCSSIVLSRWHRVKWKGV